MRCYSLSWSVGKGAHCVGGNRLEAVWEDVEKILDQIKVESGTVTLDVFPAQEIGPQSLQVQTENNYSIITLGEDTGQDYIVRLFSNSNILDADKIEVLGNLWDSRLVCNDFHIVEVVFKYFFETGDVPREILN